MFCMKCGKPTEDGQVICPECAAAAQPAQEQPVEIPVEEAATFEAPIEEMPAAQMPVEEPVSEAPAEAPVFEAPAFEAPAQEAPQEALFDLNFSSEPAKKARKPVNKKLLTWIIAGAVALSLVTVGLLGFLVWDWGDWVQNLFWSMQPAEDYKDNIEQKALTDEDANNETALIKQGLVSVYGAFVNYAGPQDGAAEVTLDVELGKELISLLELALGGQLPDGMEIPTNASMTFGSNASGDTTQVDIGFGLNKVQIMQLRAILDAANELGYVGILSPEGMAKDYLSLDISEVMEEMNDSTAMITLMTELAAELPSQEEFAAMLDRYILLAFEQVQEVEKEKETIEADGVKQSFTVLTYEISEETLLDIALVILEEAEDDETLYQIVQAFCNFANKVNEMQYSAYDGFDGYYGYYEPEYYDPDELFDQIPDLIEELEEVDPDDETLIEIDTYVDSKGNICGRKITIDEADAEIVYVTAISGGKIGILAEADIEGQKVTLEGSGKVKKGSVVTGTLTLTAEKQELLVLELEGFDIKTGLGTVRIMLGDDAKDLLEENMGASMGMASMLNVADLAIELKLNTNSIAISLLSGKKTMVTVTLSATAKDATKVSIPKNSVLAESEADLASWISALDMNKLADQLGKAGMPAEIVDAVRNADPSELFGGTAADSYDDFYADSEVIESGYYF